MPPRRGQHRPHYQERVNFADDSQGSGGYQRQQDPNQRRQGNRPQGRGYPNQRPHMAAMIPHIENLQQMDDVALGGLLLQLVQMVGPDQIQQIAQDPRAFQMPN